jgi:glutamate formiminotransferase / formiminotetrahydrofolate cyclodeaminase
MSRPLIDATLRAFSDELASQSPIPGGGSASAYAGALGAGLCAMALRISAKRSPEDLSERIAQLDGLRNDLLRLVDDDAAAYSRVAEAMKMPRASDDEKAARARTLQAGLLAAARVPLEIAKTARRLLAACEGATALAAPTLVSDVGVGALMAETALRGAALNVMVNLGSLEDHGQVKALSEELDHAVEGSEEERARILQYVESRIAR